MSDTPLCDEALTTHVGVPPGLESALRNVERTARAARARLGAIVQGGRAAPAVAAALERLDMFLDDARRSPLRRALRRPLRQIALGTLPWRRLESAWRSAVLRADAAARLQGAIDELRGALARVESRFGADLPYWTRFHLQRERVTGDEIERLRRDDARKPVLERLRRVEMELARIHAHLPSPEYVAAMQLGRNWPGGVNPGELMAATVMRLSERFAGRAPAGQTERLRLAAARHLRELGAAGDWARTARKPAHTVAEQIANASLASAGELEWRDDGPLWAGMIAAAQDALHAPRRRGAWQPALPPRGAPASGEEAWGTTHFAIPLSPDYVLLTPETPSPARVTSRRVALDAAVECAAFSGPAGFETVEAARQDVEPLFAGLSGEPAWYRTERKARLTIVARAGALWLARLDARGELEAVRTPAWSGGAPRDARLHVLLDGVSAPPLGPVAVGSAGDAEEFGGVARREVEAPFAAWRRAWLKTAAEERDHDRLEAEHAFFRAVARQAGGLGLRPLGRGRTDRPAANGYLYAPPFAFSDAESPPLARWMDENPILFIAAAARLAAALSGIGQGLGVYHRSALAFRIEWTPAGLARPMAVATAAPFAAPLGRTYVGVGRRKRIIPELGGLGMRLLPSAVAAGGVATPEAEAQAWALFALDLLARKRLPASLSGTADLAAFAAEAPEGHFHVPDAAARLGRALTDWTVARALLEQLSRLGEDPSPR
jgi:hypothetical protein